MKKLMAAVVLLIFGFPPTSAAQTIPHVAVFGGYTYVRAKYSGGGPGFGLNGWDGSLELKPGSWLGIVADVSQQYLNSSEVENQTTALFGPQISIPNIPRFIPYAHVLAGVVHGTSGVYAPTGAPCAPETTCHGNAFATAVGLDIHLSGHVWIRAIQVDWLHGNLSQDHHLQARLATGIVIRFGRCGKHVAQRFRLPETPPNLSID